MSVLIKGMEMPRTCRWCIDSGLRTAIRCDEWKWISAGRIENERAWSCPLVTLPEKHGRLIDADEITAFLRLERNDEEVASLNEFPTVIEAEGE